jgi:hypothetical protein
MRLYRCAIIGKGFRNAYFHGRSIPFPIFQLIKVYSELSCFAEIIAGIKKIKRKRMNNKMVAANRIFELTANEPAMITKVTNPRIRTFLLFTLPQLIAG